jgi:hypothetical protein
MLTMLGFVILIGTVVNNAILIVHQALNYMRDEGYEDKAAIVESVRTRVRPIFMTTTTTVLGMLPLVLPMPYWGEDGFQWVAGAGSELYRGLGSVVLGGLIVSTVFTLVLIPIAFSLAVDLKNAVSRLFGFRPAELAAPGGGRAAVDLSEASLAPPPVLVAAAPRPLEAPARSGRSVVAAAVARPAGSDGNGDVYELDEDERVAELDDSEHLPDTAGGDASESGRPEPAHSGERR